MASSSSRLTTTSRRRREFSPTTAAHRKIQHAARSSPTASPAAPAARSASATMAELAEQHPNIVAIKESGGSIERFSQLRRALPERVSILCGDDSMTLPALAVGAAGVVSVASNLIPREVGEMVRTFLKGHAREAEQLHRRILSPFPRSLHRAESRPGEGGPGPPRLDDRRCALATGANAGGNPRPARCHAQGNWHRRKIMSQEKTRVIIVGSRGRMGEALTRLAGLDDAAGADRRHRPGRQRSRQHRSLPGADRIRPSRLNRIARPKPPPNTAKLSSSAPRGTPPRNARRSPPRPSVSPSSSRPIFRSA